MTKTFLTIGDPHFKVENVLDVEKYIESMITVAEEKKPDYIICLGDLLHNHERLHTLILNKAYEFVHKMRDIATTYVIVGNHDMIDPSQFITENHWMNGMKEWENVIIVDKVEELNIDGLYFVLVPFVPPGRFQEALETLGNEKWKNADGIFCHQEFYGCKMGAFDSVEGDKWPENFPEIIAGHIHSKQRPQKNIYYPGASMQHSFGEAEKTSVALIEFSENPYKTEEIDLGMPRKKIIYIDLENIDEFVPKKTEDKIKITLSGQHEDFKTFKKSKKYKELVQSGVKVIYKPKRKQNIIEEKYKNCDREFEEILRSIVTEEDNEQLTSVYNYIILGRNKDEEILII